MASYVMGGKKRDGAGNRVDGKGKKKTTGRTPKKPVAKKPTPNKPSVKKPTPNKPSAKKPAPKGQVRLTVMPDKGNASKTKKQLKSKIERRTAKGKSADKAKAELKSKRKLPGKLISSKNK